MVDIAVFLALILLFFMVILPFFDDFLRPDGEYLSLPIAGVVLVLVLLINFAVQYPFMVINQTIGKAFFGLRIVSTNNNRPMTFWIVFQRELFAKVFTMYLMAIPVIFGRQGQHDVACETEVV